MLSKLGLFKTIYTPKVNINIHAKSQAGNIWVKYIMTIQKGQSWKKINEGS